VHEARGYAARCSSGIAECSGVPGDLAAAGSGCAAAGTACGTLEEQRGLGQRRVALQRPLEGDLLLELGGAELLLVDDRPGRLRVDRIGDLLERGVGLDAASTVIVLGSPNA
jgi:hypothetical protein